MSKVNLTGLQTERQNAKTSNLGSMSSWEIISLMNAEDTQVLATIKEALPSIEKVVEACIICLKQKGRIIYAGAGTSGRLGILDAVECVPTFSTTDEVIGLIAGGEGAFIKAVEGAEDRKDLAINDLKNLNLGAKDIVIALAASGRTPYAIGALEYAKTVGSKTASVSCNKNAELSKFADLPIEVDAGPEVLTGSTRLKAGTSQKMILNMISTASMVGIGKVYKNLMVDMKSTNVKLIERAKTIVMLASECDYLTAEEYLKKTDFNIKEAIVMILTGFDLATTKQKIDESEGCINRII